MKQSLKIEIDSLNDKLCNYCGVFAYQLRNLTIKADAVALLDIKVFSNGEMLKIEECATVAKKDEYNFIIVPNFEEDIPSLTHAIFKCHPEWKQTIEKMTVQTRDIKNNPKDEDVPYVLCTMPEVDDDRYDVLKDGVKLLYDNCKVQMEAAIAKSDLKFAEQLLGEDKAAKDELDENVDIIKNEWIKSRDIKRDNKLKEIEEAYQKWLKKVEGKSKK